MHSRAGYGKVIPTCIVSAWERGGGVLLCGRFLLRRPGAYREAGQKMSSSSPIDFFALCQNHWAEGGTSRLFFVPGLDVYKLNLTDPGVFQWPGTGLDSSITTSNID